MQFNSLARSHTFVITLLYNLFVWCSDLVTQQWGIRYSVITRGYFVASFMDYDTSVQTRIIGSSWLYLVYYDLKVTLCASKSNVLVMVTFCRSNFQLH